MGNEYHRIYFNPDDSKEYVPKILGLLERNNNGEMISYFQQPLLTLTVTIPVDAEHNFSSKVDRLMDENTYLQSNKDSFATLTPREKVILALMAFDKSSSEIAAKLHISEDTVKTHRRNIKKKINAENLYDVIKFAQAFDML
eukprot:gene30162-39359_t